MLHFLFCLTINTLLTLQSMKWVEFTVPNVCVVSLQYIFAFFKHFLPSLLFHFIHFLMCSMLNPLCYLHFHAS